MLEDQPYDILGTEVPPITNWVPEMARYLPMPNWFGFMVPAETPEPIVERIDAAFQNILERPEVKEYLANTNTDLLGLTGEAADEMAARQERVHSWILYDLGLVTISPEDFGIERP